MYLLFQFGTFSYRSLVDHASKCHPQSYIRLLCNRKQEIVTGKVPYFEYKTDGGIVRALDKKKPPIRPAIQFGPDERANRMWRLLTRCWDHDPNARPEAASLLQSVRIGRCSDTWYPLNMVLSSWRALFQTQTSVHRDGALCLGPVMLECVNIYIVRVFGMHTRVYSLPPNSKAGNSGKQA